MEREWSTKALIVAIVLALLVGIVGTALVYENTVVDNGGGIELDLDSDRKRKR